MSDVLIVALAVGLVWYLTAGWRAERRAQKDAAWIAHIDSIVTEGESNVHPITDAPGFDRITNLIAANEAARADWDEPFTWGDPA